MDMDNCNPPLPPLAKGGVGGYIVFLKNPFHKHSCIFLDEEIQLFMFCIDTELSYYFKILKNHMLPGLFFGKMGIEISFSRQSLFLRRISYSILCSGQEGDYCSPVATCKVNSHIKPFHPYLFQKG